MSMRCNRCNYENSDGNSSCLKCGHPLNTQGQQSMNNGVIDRETVRDIPVTHQDRITVCQNNGDIGSERQTAIFNSRSEAGGDTHSQHKLQCPKCHYPIREGAHVCPSCGAEIAIESPSKAEKVESAICIDTQSRPCPKCGKSVDFNNVFCPHCGVRIPQVTIKIKPKPREVYPACALTLMPEAEESIEAKKLTYDFKGEAIVLNRDNTEPNNYTITSKVQATLVCEEGHWYIENHAECNPTCLLATRRLELQPGDTILLGDRRFTFSKE